MTIQNPHDHFFRDSFSRPEIARNYLEEYLPADVSALLDLDHLLLQDSSFIDETMQEHQTDLLYSNSRSSTEIGCSFRKDYALNFNFQSSNLT